jgi:hypothetical protein
MGTKTIPKMSFKYKRLATGVVIVHTPNLSGSERVEVYTKNDFMYRAHSRLEKLYNKEI